MSSVRLCLGTVQFGMRYGINNQLGRQPSCEEAFEILDAAFDHGIRDLDTASVYGNAEEILGEYFDRRPGRREKLRIFSKLRPGVLTPTETDPYGVVCYELEASLKRLHTNHLDGFLLHAAEDVYDQRLIDALRRLREEKLVERVGVSIYELREGWAALDTAALNMIQLPYSIMDQRGIQEGLIQKAKQQGYSIATRSAFLQGLLQMEEAEIPGNLHAAIPYVREIKRILSSYHLDLSTAALGFVKAEQDIDYLVFGAETREVLLEDIEKFNAAELPVQCVNELKAQIDHVDESIILPSRWQKP